MVINYAHLAANSAQAIDALLPELKPSAERDDLVGGVMELCEHFQMVAAATLLLDGDAQGFFSNLCHAAENWRRLLHHLHAQGWHPPPASWNMPLVGVLASGHWELARQVALASSRAWQPDEEYEDDFLWARILQELTPADWKTNPLLDEQLRRLVEAGDGFKEKWFPLIQAMRSSDQQGFLNAFSDVLFEHQQQIEEQASGAILPVITFAPGRYIWLEGLAFLRMGERAGISLHNEHLLYCPFLARVPMFQSVRYHRVISLGV